MYDENQGLHFFINKPTEFFLSLVFAAQYPSQLLLAIKFSLKEWHRNVYLPLPMLQQDFGLLILYSLCQYMENLGRKTFHFLQLKSVLQGFRERRVCGWDGCSPEACTGYILRCFLRRRSGSRHTFLHGAPSAELCCGVWTRLSASCICSCLVFQCCVSSFQELPKWGRGFVCLNTGLDATAGFCAFPSLRNARLMNSCCQWNTRTCMGGARQKYISRCCQNIYFLSRKYQSWKSYSITMTLFLPILNDWYRLHLINLCDGGDPM